MIPPQILATFDMTGEYVTLTLPGYGQGLRLARRSDLWSARADIYWPLAEFRRLLSELSESGSRRARLVALTEAIRYLAGQTESLAYKLVGQRGDLLAEIRHGFRQAWRDWQYATDIVPLVEVRGDDMDFPFEMLPLFDFADTTDLQNYAEAEDLLRRYVGYSLVVRRRDAETPPPDLQGTPLPLQYFSYEHDGTSIETSYFEEVLPRLRLEGPWPSRDLDIKDAAERLIDALYDPAGKLDGRVRGDDEPPVQIQYFSCHCETQSRDSGYTLILGNTDREVRVTLGALRLGFSARLRAKASDVAGHRPLIIVNACSSALIDKESRASFQQFFISSWHRGFVGTETAVPEKDAASFAVLLYQELFDGRPLGEAMVRARRRLLGERGSPIGLLYVLYGDPLLRITGPQSVQT